jgi:hypothetical protein
MKKLISIGSILLVGIFLVGCQSTTDDPIEDPIINPVPLPVACELWQEFDEETRECIDIDGDFYLANNKEVVDLMYYYTIGNKGVDIYNRKGDTTSYINIEDFMTQIQKLTTELTFTIADGLAVSYTVQLQSPYANMYGTNELVYQVVFDPELNQIKISDLDFYSVINAPVESTYTELIIDSIEYFGPPMETVISLDEYGMALYEEVGNYYIPSYLASLFLTGDAVSVYETDDSIILFDNGADFNQLEILIDNSSQTSPDGILQVSENYLKLYFEYFYGLDEELEYDFDTLIDSYQFSEQTSFRNYYTQLDQFLLDLDDIHTSLITSGFNDDYVSRIDFEDGSRWETMYDAIGTNKCYFLNSEYDYFIEATTMYITVNGFSEDTLTLVNEVIGDSFGVENVVIDLRCNSGGSLLGVLELMTLLTDAPIPLNVLNPQTGVYEKQNIVNYTSRALDANFYVLTSEVTFSGGNLFASFVKDMEAGILIGTPSLGGACAINVTVLPDGSIFVASSNMVLMNANDEITEFGITPDIVITEYIDDITELDYNSYVN